MVAGGEVGKKEDVERPGIYTNGSRTKPNKYKRQPLHLLLSRHSRFAQNGDALFWSIWSAWLATPSRALVGKRGTCQLH